MINFEIFLAIGMFTAIVLALVLIILAARAKLVSSGDVSIEINGEKTIVVPAGGKLLQTLADNDIFLSSACGGGGTCAQCKCVVESGGGEMLSTETGAILPMQVEDLGLEQVRVGEGSVEARHYRVTSDLVASFWYDDQGRWVKCAFKARGSNVEYVLRALPG